eukprot:1254258-Rhodomonas_salina.1
MPEVLPTGLGYGLGQLTMRHANLSCLSDGSANALGDDGVAALCRDIEAKEVLAEGLVLHQPPHPEDKGE